MERSAHHRPVLRSLMAVTTGSILVAAVFAPRSHGAARDRDESEIRAVQARQAEAWNRHDAKTYADLFEDDGDVVNVVGWWWKGRAEIESKLTAAFAGVFRESTLTITETEVRFLSPDIAVAHVRWTMTGSRMPPPIPEPRAGIQTQVLRKTAGRWRISAFQNTNAVPEMAFPPGPERMDAPETSGPERNRKERKDAPRAGSDGPSARLGYGFGAGFSFLVARALPSAAEAWGFQKSGS